VGDILRGVGSGIFGQGHQAPGRHGVIAID